MNYQEELIWKYLDGSATDEERQAVSERMEEDPAFRSALLERKKLSDSLEEMETEQPSLRFATNVMDRLPDLYRSTIEPLVRPFWIRFFFSTLAAFLAGYFALVFFSLSRGQLPAEGQTSSYAAKFAGLFPNIPSQVLSITAALSIAYLLLVLLDRRLKRQWLSKGKDSQVPS